MNVFVLNTGRVGSQTFSKACRHITNYTSAHESNHRNIGVHRLQYPRNHIEVDMRLSWFLGSLEKKYPDAFYVHLTRDVTKVANSFMKKWDTPRGIMRGFADIILSARGTSDKENRLETAHQMIETVNDNIHSFLKNKESMKIDIKDAAMIFPTFCDRIGAVVPDYTKIVGEFSKRYGHS